MIASFCLRSAWGSRNFSLFLSCKTVQSEANTDMRGGDLCFSLRRSRPLRRVPLPVIATALKGLGWFLYPAEEISLIIRGVSQSAELNVIKSTNLCYGNTLSSRPLAEALDNLLAVKQDYCCCCCCC